MNFSHWDTLIESSYMASISRSDDLRPMLSSILSNAVNEEFKSNFPWVGSRERLDSDSVNSLKLDGAIKIENMLSEIQVKEVTDYFSRKLIYPGHIASLSRHKPDLYGAVKNRYKQAAYSLFDIVNAPHLLEVSNSESVLAIAEAYLGCIPTIYSMNCWWSFPGEVTATAVAQRYHRDPDDLLFCSMFIYLTDVGEENGPHVYLKKSHDVGLFRRVLSERESCNDEIDRMVESSIYRDGNSSDIESIVDNYLQDLKVKNMGNAGSTFIEDTYGLHKGCPLESGERLVFWVRYGMRKTPSYIFDNTKPEKCDLKSRIGDDPLVMFTNRLIAY